jgi:hypothetical protein
MLIDRGDFGLSNHYITVGNSYFIRSDRDQLKSLIYVQQENQENSLLTINQDKAQPKVDSAEN